MFNKSDYREKFEALFFVFRSRKAIKGRGIVTGKAYFLTDLKETRKNMCHRDARNVLWKSAGKNAGKVVAHS